jgi:catechol 2,3-dioxygenase-like lactoylglutathione lyase family enzyme
MIIGAHILLYSHDPEADRAFFRDVLGFPHVDAGHGWLIFKLPPAETAVHPVDSDDTGQVHAGHRLLGAVLYLMCDDLAVQIAVLKAKGIECTKIDQANWGIKTTIKLPGGGEIGLYQPRHATAFDLK